MAFANINEELSAIYVGYFGRAADPSGLDYWIDNYNDLVAAGHTALDAKIEIAVSFSTNTEAQNEYSFLKYPTLMSDVTSIGTFIDSVYQNLFNRTADTEGKAYWTTFLQNAGDSLRVGKFILAVMNGAQNTDLYKDITTMENKAEVSLYYAQEVATHGATWTSADDLSDAVTALSGITDTTASVTAAKASVDTLIAADLLASGMTYTLTTSPDTIAGTSGNDTITGVSAAGGSAATDTLSIADSIDGGAGSDTLSVTNTANAVLALAGAIIKNVETINIRQATTGQTSTHDASTTAGVTAVNANLASGTVTVTNLASGASAGMIGDGTLANGALNAGYVAAATAATLNISGGTTAGNVTLTGAGVTAATVNSTGAANTIGALAGAATTTSTTINATTKLTTGAVTNAGATLTITGAGAVDLSTTALEAAVTKLDASANSGGVTVKLPTAVTATVTGGSGNDVITTNAVLTTGSVNAGAGTDTLDLGANVVHANTAALAAKYTGFETLRVNGTYDASLISTITAVELSGAVNVVTNLTATQAAAVTARADIGATTLTLATATGTSDVLNLTMGTGLTTAAATNAGVLTITGFETLNLTTAAGPTATTGANRTTTITGAIVDTSLTAINLKGTAVTFTDIATTKAVTIDGSALTGDGAATPVGLTVAGNATAGSTITGSAFMDTITLGTAGSTYNLGGGNDSISGTLAQYRTGVTYNTIDGGAGTDTATITGGAALTMVDDDFKGLTNVEKITVASTTVNDQDITTGGWFDAGFKATGVTLTTTTTTGAVKVAAGSFTGNLTVTATTGAVVGSNAITTGSGNDTVTLTNTSVTGTSTIATGAGADTITGGAAADTITGGAGADTINGGAGADVFVYAAGDSSSTATDSITGYATTEQIDHTTLNVTQNSSAVVAASGKAGLAGAGAAATFNAADNTLALHIVAIEAALADATHTAGEAAHWQEGADTYVFITDGVAGVGANDVIIKLVGIDSTNAAFDVLTIAANNLTLA